jgi:prophage DNA circulation protein
LEAFLLGDDYHIERDALLEVLQSDKELEFQHPYQGLFTVRLLGDYEVIENDGNGRTARIRFTVHEAGESFPLIATDTAAAVTTQAAVALAALEENTRFDVLGAITDVVDSIVQGIQSLNSKMRSVNGKIGATLGTLDNITAAITDLDKQITTLINSPQVLMNKLNALKSSVVALVKDFLPAPAPQGVQDTPLDRRGILVDALSDITSKSLEPSVIPTNTPQGAQEASAIEALNLVDRAGMVAATVEAIAAIELESANDAATTQVVLVAELDAILGTADLNPEIFEAFSALKGAIVRHLTVQQQDLPALASVTPPRTLPTLVLAHQLYGDANRDADIIRRNRIRHPGFLAGGAPLEVLSSDGNS